MATAAGRACLRPLDMCLFRIVAENSPSEATTKVGLATQQSLAATPSGCEESQPLAIGVTRQSRRLSQPEGLMQVSGRSEAAASCLNNAARTAAALRMATRGRPATSVGSSLTAAISRRGAGRGGDAATFLGGRLRSVCRYNRSTAFCGPIAMRRTHGSSAWAEGCAGFSNSGRRPAVCRCHAVQMTRYR